MSPSSKLLPEPDTSKREVGQMNQRCRLLSDKTNDMLNALAALDALELPTYSSSSRIHVDPLGGKDMVSFVSASSQRKWVDHYSVYADQSTQFRELFAYEEGKINDDPLRVMKGFVRIEGAPRQYRLNGVSEWDFESLMWGLKPKLGREVPLERLCSMLVLATDWGFTDLREHAIQEIPKHSMEPIKRVALARQTKIITWKWLMEPYVAFCTRVPPVTYEDGQTLGLKTVMAINLARSRILERRLELIRGEYPPAWMGINLFHSGCWKSMVEMWKEVICQGAVTHSYESPVEAMKWALEKRKAVFVRGKPAKPLCWSCDNETRIEHWLGMSRDVQIAERLLRANLS